MASALAGLTWNTTEVHLEAASTDKTATGVFPFTNKTANSITITETKSSCGCTTAKLEKKTYAPNESGEIVALFDLGNRVSQQQKTIKVFTDDSKEKIKQWISENGILKTTFIENLNNLGISKTCNILLANFQGEYYSLLGADDIFLPDKIQRQVSLFESCEENVSFIYSDVKVINEKGIPIQESYFKRIDYKLPESGYIFDSLLKKNFIPALSVLVRTATVKEMGGYDESLAFDDWDMWLKLSSNYKIAYLNKPTALYRIHEKSFMQNAANLQKLNRSYISMFKKYIGDDQNVNQLVYKKIREASVYSYYKGDPEISRELLWCLKHDFRIKVLFYYLLSILGVRLTFKP